MNSEINKCPYCDSALLRHARQKGVYWFCTSCWQEVPSLSDAILRSDNGMASMGGAKGTSTVYRAGN